MLIGACGQIRDSGWVHHINRGLNLWPPSPRPPFPVSVNPFAHQKRKYDTPTDCLDKEARRPRRTQFAACDTHRGGAHWRKPTGAGREVEATVGWHSGRWGTCGRMSRRCSGGDGSAGSAGRRPIRRPGRNHEPPQAPSGRPLTLFFRATDVRPPVVGEHLQALRRGRPRRPHQRRALRRQARDHRRDHRPQPRAHRPNMLSGLRTDYGVVLMITGAHRRPPHGRPPPVLRLPPPRPHPLRPHQAHPRG